MNKHTHKVIIALGSNEGASAATIQAAADKIGHLPATTVAALSSLYRSEPAYLEGQPLFTNAVLVAQTALGPHALLSALQHIEQDFGRVRTVPNGPRTLDLDIIDYEGVTSDDPQLTLPHPLALERDFVVTPLLEVAPRHQLANGTPVTRQGIRQGRVLPGTPPGTPVPTTTSPGRLSICATPIGNLGDITLRVLEALQQANIIYAEDTRVTRKLLTHFNIHTRLERCDENVMAQRIPTILAQLEQGMHIAYVTDAGTPGISDPGLQLVAAAHASLAPAEAHTEHPPTSPAPLGQTLPQNPVFPATSQRVHTPQPPLGTPSAPVVEALPGASAVLTALAAAGFAAQGFYFGGFLPRKKAQLAATLDTLAALDTVLVFYESPHRTAKALAAIAQRFPTREVALARELTKLHEEVLRGPAPHIAALIEARAQAGHPLKGEVVLVIAPPSPQETAATKRTHTDKYAPKPKS
jgi:16S rRNA (cytidine1402-2'-O)-methyltransferase